MGNINVIVIVVASIAAMVGVYLLYAIIMFKGVKKEDELQLTTKNVLEQVKILFEKREFALVELLASKYLDRVPNHAEVRKYLIKSFFQEKKYNNTIKHSQIILKKNPQDAETLKILADCYIQKGFLEKAVSIYENLFDKHPRDTEVIQTLAELYVNTEDLYSAISAYNILRDNTPETDKDILSDVYSTLATLNEKVRDYPAAYDAYKAKLEIVPSDVETNERLVELHLKLRNRQKAIEVLLYMLTFVTDSRDLVWCYEKLITLYVEDENYQSAIEYSEKLLEIQTTDKSKIRNNIAKYKICLGQYKEGIAIYEELVVLSQNDFDITIALADAYITCGEYEKALNQYMLLLDKSSSKDAKSIRYMVCEMYIKWAIAMYESKNYNTATEYLEKAKEYNAINPEIYYYIAQIKIAAKNYLEAVENILLALDYDKAKTNHIKYLLLMSSAQHELGNQFEEKKAITDLLRLDSNNIQGLLNIGIMYLTQHDTKTAEEFFKKVISIDPNCDDAKYNLAMIYETSSPEKAKALFIEILEHNPQYIGAKNALDEMSPTNYY